MSSSLTLMRKIEGMDLPHLLFNNLYEEVHARLSAACAGFDSRIEVVIGPTRVGKTVLIKKLMREFPERKVDHRREVPVLSVALPPNISPLMLPTSVMTALGVPFPAKGATTGALYYRMVAQLEKARTRAIIIDEASHLVESGAKVPTRSAGDWFKSVAERLNLTLILLGVPRLTKLIGSNEQTELRASRIWEFRPYDYRIKDQRDEFTSCVKGYVQLFESDGWSFELPLTTLVPNIYLLSGGLVGILSRFMQELAYQMRAVKPRAITFEDCRKVAGRINSAGHPDYPAFSVDQVLPEAVINAHTTVLKTNDMPIPRIPKSEETP